MKKLLLTLSAVIGVSAAAFGQGSLHIEDTATPDFGAVSTFGTNANDSVTSHYYSGTMTLEIFAIQNASLATLQADQSGLLADAGNNVAALALLGTDGYVQQTINGATSISIAVNGGGFQTTVDTIGNSSTITTSAVGQVNTDYVLYGSINGGASYGILALNPSVSGAPTPGTPADMNTIWPGGSSQAFNLYLQPVPEPTTLALAGLGGLSMLFLRRRKV